VGLFEALRDEWSGYEVPHHLALGGSLLVRSRSDLSAHKVGLVGRGGGKDSWRGGRRPPLYMRDQLRAPGLSVHAHASYPSGSMSFVICTVIPP